MSEALPPELETLGIEQVAASFGRAADWWMRVKDRYVAELGFPAPLAAPFVVRPDKVTSTKRGRKRQVYNKAAVIEWHRRNSGQFAAELAPAREIPPNLAALDRAR